MGLRVNTVHMHLNIARWDSLELYSVFLPKVFLRLGTQVRRFGRKLNALDVFSLYYFDAKL